MVSKVLNLLSVSFITCHDLQVVDKLLKIKIIRASALNSFNFMKRAEALHKSVLQSLSTT